jgi:hypothetical protein
MQATQITKSQVWKINFSHSISHTQGHIDLNCKPQIC